MIDCRSLALPTTAPVIAIHDIFPSTNQTALVGDNITVTVRDQFNRAGLTLPPGYTPMINGQRATLTAVGASYLFTSASPIVDGGTDIPISDPLRCTL